MGIYYSKVDNAPTEDSVKKTNKSFQENKENTENTEIKSMSCQTDQKSRDDSTMIEQVNSMIAKAREIDPNDKRLNRLLILVNSFEAHMTNQLSDANMYQIGNYVQGRFQWNHPKECNPLPAHFFARSALVNEIINPFVDNGSNHGYGESLTDIVATMECIRRSSSSPYIWFHGGPDHVFFSISPSVNWLTSIE
jgi:hypothetical protein